MNHPRPQPLSGILDHESGAKPDLTPRHTGYVGGPGFLTGPVCLTGPNRGTRGGPGGGHRRHRGQPRRGGTLVDLTITVFVIGILAAAAVPEFASVVGRLRCESVARRIAADLNHARQTAIRTSRETRVTFHLDPPRYEMTAVDDPHNPFETYAVDLADLDPSAELAFRDLNGGDSVVYNAYGHTPSKFRSDDPATVSVAIGRSRWTVRLHPATGEAILP